nr:hypothetical protein [uncultured Desulfovibrio sp.]
MRNDILTAIHGILAGYATDAANRTGCTAIIRPGGCTPGLAVHGFAPGSRETELLRPESLVDSVHGMLLAGGSAFGLTAADAYSRYADSADAVSVGRVLTGAGKDWTWGKYSAGPLGWLESGHLGNRRPGQPPQRGRRRLRLPAALYGRASGPRLGTPQPRGPCRGSAGRLAARDPGRRFPQRRVLPGL